MLQQHGEGQHQQPRRRLCAACPQPPFQPSLFAHHPPDGVADIAPVAAADEAAGAEEVMGDGIGRAARLRGEGGQQVDRGGDPGRGGQIPANSGKLLRSGNSANSMAASPYSSGAWSRLMRTTW